MQTNRQSRPPRDRSPELTGMIVQAAMELFREKGFTATTVGDIAAKVRMSKATFYARFPSKDAVLEAGIIDISERLLPKQITHDFDDLPFGERLEKTMLFLLSIGLHPEAIGLQRLIMAENYRAPQLSPMVHDFGSVPVADFLEQFFADAAEKGEVGAMPTTEMAEIVADFMTSLTMRVAQGIGPESDDAAQAYIRRMVRLLVAGAAKR